MGKGPSNGGVIASRGFIFQTIVAEIQCLERDDWDAIKVEPETENDKVDIMLYKEGQILSAMQVKSSVNSFSDTKVRDWLEKLHADAGDAEEIRLYLVGDSFTSSCEDFISKNRNEIRKISFENIQNICIDTLIKYIKSKGADWDVWMDEYEFISDALFSKLFKNSVSQEQVSRAEFEERFQRALPVYIIPKCLTTIPAVNHTVGLVGRGEIKKIVRDMLEKNGSMALVNGLGGIGKTAVMQYVCNDLRDEGKYVAWVECGGSLKEDLLLLRTALGIPESDNADTAYAKIISELKANRQLAGNIYLFMDNLSRVLSDEEQQLLAGLNIHVMATSRFSHDYFKNLSLDVLKETAALDMFYGYYLERQTDKIHRFENAAREIIESVQRHTLLVELLAKAAAKKGGTLEDFRDDLKEQGVFDVFRRNISTKHDRNRTIEECVIELYKISGLTSAQQHIMKLFTIFTPEKEIYYKVGEWAELDMDAMDQLVELGWLDQGGLENGYQIHQIVRDSLARQMEKDGEKVRLEEYGTLLDNVIDIDSYLGRKITYEKVRERIALTEDFAGFFEEAGREDAVAAVLFNNIASVYLNQGNYDRSLEYNGKALAIREKVLGLDHPDTAVTYNNIAGVYLNQGNYDRSLEYNRKALAIRKKVLGLNHPDTATTYNNMANVFKDQGDFDRALEYNGKALAIFEKVLGVDHPNTASSYNSIAVAYHYQGNYDRALEYYEKALIIREKVLGLDHPDTALTYNNIASVYLDQGNYDRALAYFEKAQVIREKVLGLDHPDTASTYNNIAGMYLDQGNYDRALAYFEKAKVIYEKVLGMGHPNTALTYNNIANVYHYQGNYDRALAYCEKARVIREKVQGLNHPDTATTYNNIASVYLDQGNYDRALAYFEKAKVINEKALGLDHPDTATTYNNIALVYKEQGNYDRALEYYKKALDIYEKGLCKDHPNTATAYNNIAGVYYAQGNYNWALEYFKKNLVICEKVLGKNHQFTAATYNNMAILYYAQGNYDMAQAYFEDALVIWEKVLGRNHPSTATTYNNIASVYKNQGNYDKALDYYKKANQVFLQVYGENHLYTRDSVLSIQTMELLLMTGMTEKELKKTQRKNPPE